jgi:signal transduction histidine kinase
MKAPALLIALLCFVGLAGPRTLAMAATDPVNLNTDLAPLSEIMEVRKLSPKEASRAYPVHITGVVTFSDQSSYLHFVQDETAGIYLDPSTMSNAPVLRSGQKIEVTGFSGPGDYAPIILAQSIRLLGESVLPAPENVTFRKLMTGNFDSQWVELKGVVRNQWVETNLTRLALFSGDGVIKALVWVDPKEMETPSLIDAAVAIRGVCTTVFDDHRRLQGVALQVPGWQHVEVKEAPRQDPFELPVKSVSDLFQFDAGGSEQHRVRLSGVVTLVASDGSFYMQDSSGGMQIMLKQGGLGLRVGVTVEAVGFPVIVDQLATLQDALVNPSKKATAVEAIELKTDRILDDSLQATLIGLRGEILGHFSHRSEELLTLRFGQRIIDVVLEKGSRQDQLARLAPGTVVSLRGVFLGQFDSSGKIQSFRLMLRSAEDVSILSKPAWWTVRRTVWALGGLASVLLLALGWVRALRRQVRQRTGELHEEIEHHKRTEAKLEAEIAERKRMELEVARTHQELLIASRQAGMAEVATSVLHNVGNVLNSVNVSANLVADRIRRSKVSNIARAAEMLDQHALDLQHFLTQDPKGRQLPQYLGRLAKHLDTEQNAIFIELESLRKNVEHIKGIVVMQQNYAKVFGSSEPVKPTELVEDALRMHSGALVRHEVQVVREYQENLPEVTVDKHKLLQIVVNLIGNAKKACDESRQPQKLLTVRIVNGEGRLKISVIDNGVGIPLENLTRIFNHGFTTRKDGHGFGLHSGALAAKEMGGALVAQSEGPGKGAQFTIELPV